MGTSVSRACMAHVRTIAAAIAAFALVLGLLPATSLAADDGTVAASFTGAESEGSGEAATPNSSSEGSQSAIASQVGGGFNATPTLASTLAGTSTSIVSADIALDSADPVVGSFTVDGLTYAVDADGLTLVAVAPDAVADGSIAVPASVAYDDATYPVTAIGPYAFYLSGATSVELPASILSVDDRAFRSSDVARVEVAAGNPTIASFDGCLYDSQLLSLLLIPEGRAGAVLLPETAEVVEASKFSHCSLVDAISVGEGGAAFASWDGLLYDASGTTLLRVPAGATDITIRDGCTTIAAGALEGCAKLERINAPASVTSISPDVFESVPTVTLPATAVAQVDSVAGPLAGPGYEGDARSASADSPAEGEVPTQLSMQEDASSGVASGLPDQANASTDSISQLTAMVALSSADDDLPEVDPSSIEVMLLEGASAEPWEELGFDAVAPDDAERQGEATAAEASSYDAAWHTITIYKADNTAFTAQVQYGYGYWSYLDPPFVSTSGCTYGGVWTARNGGIQVWGAGGQCVNGSNPYWSNNEWVYNGNATFWTHDTPCSYTLTLLGNEGLIDGGPSATRTVATLSSASSDLSSLAIRREGYVFSGFFTQDGTMIYDASGKAVDDGTYWKGGVWRYPADTTLYAHWERVDFDLGFDVDSEPGDADYPGEEKPDEVINKDSGAVEIEDPKRPGYVFEGWVIPNTGGTEAIDQDLVYKGDDDKWYVDASKLPDYAGDDGRVELTARWTSVISVDVPSSVTFYADLVTQGQESREGAASSAFGQSKVANQSQVDLRVVGLESSAVKTTDTTLGADSVLKKADAATPSSSTQKLLSLYPSTKQWKPEDLQDPDAVGGSKAASAVDFDLDDILLEKSFKADDFTIAAGDTLNMGYRLNLSETGQQLDYDKLSTLSEGQSASIANVSYCFAADALPSDWDEPLWVENPDRSSNPAKYLLLKDIKEAANDLSANGASSEYYSLYKGLLDKQVTNNGAPGAGPYFQLRVDGVYLPLQLIGICQDVRSDGSKAALTFQMRDVYAFKGARSAAAGGGAFNTRMNVTDTNAGGWQSSALRATLQSTFWGYLPEALRSAIVPVYKAQQLYVGGGNSNWVQVSASETIWLPSAFEAYGIVGDGVNDGETITVGPYVPFQYQAYQPAASVNYRAVKTWNGAVGDGSFWWQRSATRYNGAYFCNAHMNGAALNYGLASLEAGVAPAFCL